MMTGWTSRRLQAQMRLGREVADSLFASFDTVRRVWLSDAVGLEPCARQRARNSAWQLRASGEREVCKVAGGGARDIRADDWQYLDGVTCAHELAAARWHASVQEQAVERDAFVPQRVALIDADHHRRQSFNIFALREGWP